MSPLVGAYEGSDGTNADNSPVAVDLDKVFHMSKGVPSLPDGEGAGMPDRLKNKVAIVTGGSAGIGQATSDFSLKREPKSSSPIRMQVAGEECVAGIRARGGEAIFVRTDISKEEDCRSVCDRAVKTFGQLNILVNNGARFILRGLEATVAEWHEILRSMSWVRR